MTRLRVYSGPETKYRLSRITGEDRPDVIPISAFTARRGRAAVADSALTRAKALHENRRCRHCGQSGVEPVMLNDGLRDGSGQYIPGTATLVGFHCTCCRVEWPV
jgi:hypothetical protein